MAIAPAQNVLLNGEIMHSINFVAAELNISPAKAARHLIELGVKTHVAKKEADAKS